MNNWLLWLKLCCHRCVLKCDSRSSKIDIKNCLVHDFSFKKMQKILYFNEFFCVFFCILLYFGPFFVCIFSVFHLSSTEKPDIRKKSQQDEKKPETLPLSGQKIQYISFWRKKYKYKNIWCRCWHFSKICDNKT